MWSNVWRKPLQKVSDVLAPVDTRFGSRGLAIYFAPRLIWIKWAGVADQHDLDFAWLTTSSSRDECGDALASKDNGEY